MVRVRAPLGYLSDLAREDGCEPLHGNAAVSTWTDDSDFDRIRVKHRVFAPGFISMRPRPAMWSEEDYDHLVTNVP